MPPLPNLEALGIEAQFQEWAKRVLVEMGTRPQDTQWIESKRAWYAGAYSLLGMLSIISNEVITEDEGAYRVDLLSQEIHRFFALVKDGKA